MAYEYFEPFSSYVWSGSDVGLESQVQSVGISVYWPGITAAVNCHPSLINIHLTMPDFDDAGHHQLKHPGAGVFSPYHNGTSQVGRRIPEGGEVFTAYWDNWYAWISLVRCPMLVLSPLHRFITRAAFDGLPTATEFGSHQELLDLFDLLDGKSEDSCRVLADICSLWNSRLGNALPRNYEDALV